MAYYPELHRELRDFFPVAATLMPSATRQYISNAWDKLPPSEQARIATKCLHEHDPLRRMLKFVVEITEPLGALPAEDTTNRVRNESPAEKLQHSSWHGKLG